MIRVGRWVRSIMQAMLKDFPLPVTPSNVWCGSPRSTPATSSAIARG
jgi:hypothetical protein